MEIVVGYCNYGAAHPSRLQRGGNREAKRRKQRAKRECLRDERIVWRTVARLLSPSHGVSDLRILEIIVKLQILQQVEVPSVEKGNSNLSKRDSPMYVGMTPHAL